LYFVRVFNRILCACVTIVGVLCGFRAPLQCGGGPAGVTAAQAPAPHETALSRDRRSQFCDVKSATTVLAIQHGCGV
jgi:hypothetical protein